MAGQFARVIQVYERVLDVTIDAAAWLARALLLFQVVSITAGVILRYVAGISFSWLNSVNEWTLLWVAFLGAPWLEREVGMSASIRLSVCRRHFGRLTRWIGCC